MIKKADIVLAVILLAAGIASSVFLLFGGGAGDTVVISVDTKIYGTYPLDENQIIDVKSAGDHFNIVEIKDGKVYITDADCPDKLCIKQGGINTTNQSIVCLPNKVMIELTGPESDGPDAYSS